MSCQPGMRLGKAIITEEGQVLLGAQVELSSVLISRLSQLGFDFLYIEDARTEDVAVAEPISEETRRMALSVISMAYSKFAQDLGSLSLREYEQVTKQVSEATSVILDELSGIQLGGPITFTNFNMLKPHDWHKYYTQNALNSCLYASMIGLSTGMDRDSLHAMGMGALLHDIGNSRIPVRLLRKAEKLTPVEYRLIQKHTEHGYDLLRNDSNVPSATAMCVLQHHERVDGKGYPFGLTGGQIHPFAKWISLIDAYDAMTNPRSYRSPLLPHQALEMLFADAGTRFEVSMVETFRNRVAIYPPGVPVRLNTGERGIVAGINAKFISRPIVRILQNEAGEEVKTPYDIDLSKRLSVMIERITCEPATA